MKLFLASIASGSLDLALPLLSSPPSKVSLAYIETAADPYPLDARPWVQYDKDKIAELGFNVSPYDIKGKTEIQLVSDLSKFDAIFMEGGSTEYLLKQVKISGFDKAILELLHKGIVYIGSSAGSCIMGKSIEHLCELDHFQIQDSVDYAGIGLVPHLIVPHYGRDKYEGRHAKMKEIWGDKLTFLTDNQAIVVNGDKIEIVTNQGGL